MKKFPLVVTSIVLSLSSTAFAQQQYDSLGMPTPRPNQSASPNDKAPNVPIPAGQPDAGASKENSSAGAPVESAAGGAQTTGSGSSAGSASGANPATGGDNQPADAGMAGSKSSPTSDPTETPNQNGVTPSGIKPD